MFERKKEICKWLNKDDYILAAGYSELDADLIDGDSYKTILKKVIEHRKEIMALPDLENPYINQLPTKMNPLFYPPKYFLKIKL